MIVIATGFILLSHHCPLSQHLVMWESSQWLRKNIVQNTGKKEILEGIDRCTGSCGITKITLKTALNTGGRTHSHSIVVLHSGRQNEIENDKTSGQPFMFSLLFQRNGQVEICGALK